jgi:hypothetical protein
MYRGEHSQADLTDANLRIELLSTYDDIVLHLGTMAALVGHRVSVTPDALAIEAADGLEALAALPIGRAITLVWQVARDGDIAPEREDDAAHACLDLLHLFEPTFVGPILITELDNDSPLLYAWMRASELLWPRGLRGLIERGHWQVAYKPSHPEG